MSMERLHSARSASSIYPPDRLFLSTDALKKLVKERPTPFYLYDESGIRNSIRAWNAAFSWNSGFQEYFPVRLCPTPGILSIFLEEGCGVFCDSPQELALAQRCGFPSERILCSALCDNDTHSVVLDGAYQLPAQPPRHALLRFNPGGRLLWKSHALTSLDRNKLGMPMDELLVLARQLRLFGTQSIGLSFDCLRNDLRPEYYFAAAKLLFEAAVHVQHETGLAPEICCLGDGPGISLRPDRADEPSFETYAAGIQELYDSILRPNGICNLRIHTTLGRRLLAHHAYFLSSVRGVKMRQRPLLMTDAAASQFPVGTSFGSSRHISVVGKNAPEGRIVCDVAPCQTEAFGLLGDGCILPPVEVGDVLVFHSAGGLRSACAAGLGFPPCPEYLLCEDGQILPLSDDVLPD